MELRKVEQELEKLSSEWKALRRKRPQFNDEANDAGTTTGEALSLSARMPSWNELKSKVKDEEIFPPEEEDDDGDINMVDESADAKNNESSADAITNNNKTSDADTEGYSEFGMCLAPTEEVTENAKTDVKNGASVWERYAAKNTAAEKPKITEPVKEQKEIISQPTVEDEEEGMTLEGASAKDVLAGLDSLNDRFVALGPKMDKFSMKLNDVSFVNFIIRLEKTQHHHCYSWKYWSVSHVSPL